MGGVNDTRSGNAPLIQIYFHSEGNGSERNDVKSLDQEILDLTPFAAGAHIGKLCLHRNGLQSSCSGHPG